MIRHTFKLIWNRKRRSMLLMGEILLSFVVLFAVASAVITSVSRYVRPLGFSHENMWVLHIDKPGDWGNDAADKANVRHVLEQVRNELVATEDVQQASFVSGNYPYSNSRWTTSFHYDNKTHSSSIWLTDDHYAEVAGLKVIEGRWFNVEDDASPRQAIVITRQMRDEVFGSVSPLGKIETDPDPGNKKERIVVGVVENYRYRGEFEPDKGGFFERNIVTDTSSDIPMEVAFTVREGSDARVEERILKHLAQVAPGWNLRIETLADARREYIRGNLLGTGVFIAIAGFLILNVALGLFGVLWQSISRRHGEIGLRRAVGASPSTISWQILMESLVLATIAIAAGIIVAAQVPILGLDSLVIEYGTSIPGGTYLIAMACGAVLIYFLVSLCAVYPSQLAARVEPAAALHDE